MEKYARAAVIGMAGLALCAFALPDNGFEGVITYSMSFSSSDQSPQAAAMMQGNNTKVYVKGDKVRTEVNSGMGKQIIIGDRKTKEEVTLVSTMAGDKYEIKSDPNKPKTNEEKPEIKYIDSTKVIAGYTCKAALATVTAKTGEKNSFVIFYTDQLPYSEEMGRYKGLKGCPMQYGIKYGSMTINMTAQDVKKQALSDTLFVVPTKGYKVVSSREEMMKDMQRNSGGGSGE
jgi:GLPGLI family protein